MRQNTSFEIVIASAAKQSRGAAAGLLRRFAHRNDEKKGLSH
jgi:hypothetical protein